MAGKLATLKSLIDWRQPGGLLSAAGHVALLVAGVVAFSTNKPFAPATEAAPVDVISEAQFNEIMRGEKQGEKKPEPAIRADRVAEIQKANDPGIAKNDVPAEPPKVEPPRAEIQKPEPDPPKQVAAIPPVRPPELRPVQTPLPTPPAKPEEPEEDEDEKAELPRKQPPKPEPKKEDLTKLLEEQKRLEEQKKAEEKKKADEKLAAEKKKADAEKRRARSAKSARRSRPRPRAGGFHPPAAANLARGPVILGRHRGTDLAAGEPRHRDRDGQEVVSFGALAACWPADGADEPLPQHPPGAMPRSTPIISIQLSRDGAIIGGPTLVNPRNEAGYTPFAEANMRALRGCAPYRIPARFMDTYNDWKNLSIGVIPPNG